MEIGPDIAACLPGGSPGTLGVAVSGGSDSTALLVLLAEWGKSAGVAISAVTVDHDLRPGSADEARDVAALAERLGVPHAILTWRDHASGGNLQDHARRARYRLIAGWAGRSGIKAVALGHTMDDQAETLLMRLERGSGVDGLAAMARRNVHDGIVWLRPLLTYRRSALRAVLVGRGIRWAEDPSNDDERFSRVRIRHAIETLGLSVDGLAETAERMATARAHLELATQQAARSLANVNSVGSVRFERTAFQALSCEIRLRLLAHAIRWVTTSRYRPRLAALKHALAAVEAGGRATLAGCIIDGRRQANILVGREFQAVKGLIASTSGDWDNRWTVRLPTGCTARAFGAAGLAACENWRESGLRRDELMAAPAIWRGSVLVASPLAGGAGGAPLSLRYSADHFFDTILSH